MRLALISLLMIPLVVGCAARHSGFAPLEVVGEGAVAMHKDGLPKAQNGCGWVTVSDKEVTSIFGITIQSKVRQFERSLFYCCPGDVKVDPRCYQADWFFRGNE